MGEEVQSNWKFKIAWVEIAEVVSTLRRNVMQELLSQIAVRIDDADAVAERNVLKDEITKESGFSGAGLSNYVDVLALILSGNAKRLGVSPALAVADHDV